MANLLSLVVMLAAIGSAGIAGTQVILWDKADDPKDKSIYFKAVNLFGMVSLCLGAVAALM